MKNILIIFFLAIAPLLIWARWQNKNDIMGEADKTAMKNISNEIMLEALLKISQINDIRDDYSNELAFDVGLIMGNIRENYRQMLELYREIRDKVSGRSQFHPPSWSKVVVPLYVSQAMERCHSLEVDIDKLVHVLESMDHEELNPDPRYPYELTTKHGWEIMLRSADDKKTILRMAEEQEFKSRAREAHLMRRMGLSALKHTTSKRFQHQWPVEESWNFGMYGDMGLYE